MTFFRNIFLIILFFYVLSLIGRTMLTVWARRRSREFARDKQRYTRAERAKARREEGRVTIRDTRTERRMVDEHVGEYVEYEEVTEIKEEGGR